MQARSRRVAAAMVAAGTIGVAIAIPTASGADSARDLRTLRGESDSLTARAHSALLEVYALDARREQTRSHLALVRERAAAVERDRAAVRRRLAVAARTVDLAQRSLAERVRAVYEQGETDPLAIILGATSLGDAIADLDGLDQLARHDLVIVEQTRAARRELARISTDLARRTAELRRIEKQAAGAAAALTEARDRRLAHLSSLRAERRLTATKIAALERESRAAREAAARLRTPTAASPSSPPTARRPREPLSARRTLTVLATGYAIRGRTATGISTGWGVAAVDPAVIPLGTRISVPGYGQAVAADVGSGIRGAMIDLWFPSIARARAWGRRTVTIVLH